MTVSIQFRGNIQMRSSWRFNTGLLSDDNFNNFISDQIDLFLSFNKMPDTSASILWETLKAYIRGQVISYLSRERRKRRERIVDLTKQIAQLDATYAIAPTSDMYKQRLPAQSE